MKHCTFHYRRQIYPHMFRKSILQTHLENCIRLNCIQPNFGPLSIAKNLSPVIWVTCSLGEHRVCIRPCLQAERGLETFGDIHLLQELPRNEEVVRQRSPVGFLTRFQRTETRSEFKGQYIHPSMFAMRSPIGPAVFWTF